MTDSAPSAPLPLPLLDRQKRAFLWRRLFSLSGVIPIGGFVLVHLWDNAKALQGRAAYVDMINSSGRTPYRTAIEIGIIFVPILFHTVLGLKYLLDARYNVGAYPYSGNWMYTLQRLTAGLVLVFLAYHLWELRLQKLLAGLDAGGYFDTLCRNLSSTMTGVPVVALLYVIGIGAAAFHVANGLWGFCFSWGIASSRRSQRLAANLFGVVGLLIFLLGANTVVYFATGSKLFIPSEWFASGKTPTEICPSQGFESEPGALTPTTPPKPQPSAVP